MQEASTNQENNKIKENNNIYSIKLKPILTLE